MNENQERIYVSHINIRQSIALLLAKLLVIELVAAGFVILCYVILLPLIPENTRLAIVITNIRIPTYLTLVTIKMAITFYIILEWLNEYYEISAKFILHRSGAIFKKEQKYAIDQIAFIEISQGILGRICNFGTINMLNMRRYPYVDMYLIHNPFRYAKIIQELNPKAAETTVLFARNITTTDGEEED